MTRHRIVRTADLPPWAKITGGPPAFDISTLTAEHYTPPADPCSICGAPCTGIWRFMPNCERCHEWQSRQAERLGPEERFDRRTVRVMRRIGFAMPDADGGDL